MQLNTILLLLLLPMKIIIGPFYIWHVLLKLKLGCTNAAVCRVEPHRMWLWIIDEDGQEVRIRFRQCMTSLYWSLAQGLRVCPVSAYQLTHIHIGVYSVFSHFVCFNFLVFTVFMPQMYTKPDHIKDFLWMKMTWCSPQWSIYRKHEKNSKYLILNVLLF